MISRTRVVVVGNGMAGARLLEEMRMRDGRRRLDITVFGAEPHVGYNRILLSDLLAGRARLPDIYLASPQWYAQQDVDVRLGVTVERIDRERREVSASDGTVTPYDVLVLATGSTPWVPPVDGITRADGSLLPGVAVFRTIDNCHRILELAGPDDRGSSCVRSPASASAPGSTRGLTASSATVASRGCGSPTARLSAPTC